MSAPGTTYELLSRDGGLTYQLRRRRPLIGGEIEVESLLRDELVLYDLQALAQTLSPYLDESQVGPLQHALTTLQGMYARVLHERNLLQQQVAAIRRVLDDQP
jgi:hypothetical protein